MRKNTRKQMPIMNLNIDHPKAIELKLISEILDEIPIIYDMALQDLISDYTIETGANGMTAEQVVRAAILKQTEGFSYEELAFHLLDSTTYRNFLKIGFVEKGFKRATLHQNIKALSPDTLESIHRIIVAYGQSEKIEIGRQSRIDCTVVCSNIHEPSSSLLWDAVRVITRKLKDLKEKYPDLNLNFSDHTKCAKRRSLGIMNAKNKKDRKKLYKKLLKTVEKVVNYATSSINAIANYEFQNEKQTYKLLNSADELKEIQDLTCIVVDQTVRRVMQKEVVPASEKIVSIFESHTDIIKKDRRDTYYGHKICLSGGASNLIIDCFILEGNPADTTLTEEMLDRHEEIFGYYPLKVSLDGGFASKDNLEIAKGKKIKDVCFAKKKGLKEEDMCRSHYVYKRLRNFRAGVEAGISWLKRCFGLDRCTWKTFRSFKSYVWASVLSANLLTIARKQMA